MIDAKMFYYNTDLLEAAGYDAPPATWTMRQSLFANGEPIYVVILTACLVDTGSPFGFGL